jgi:hypothetical protein
MGAMQVLHYLSHTLNAFALVIFLIAFCAFAGGLASDFDPPACGSPAFEISCVHHHAQQSQQDFLTHWVGSEREESRLTVWGLSLQSGSTAIGLDGDPVEGARRGGGQISS